MGKRILELAELLATRTKRDLDLSREWNPKQLVREGTKCWERHISKGKYPKHNEQTTLH